MRLTPANVDAACSVRPAGFRADLLAAGRMEGDTLVIDSEAWKSTVARHLAGFGVPEPTVAELAQNFASALARWANAGFAVADQATHADRMAVCRACSHWEGGARLGLGACRAPGCGCTRFKHWLASEKCPLGKWSA